MLTWSNIGAFSKVVIAWTIASILLQIAVIVLGIQYDSSMSLIWWINAILLLPVSFLSEVLGEIGFDVRGNAGYLLMTLSLAMILIGVTQVLREIRGH